MSEDRFDVLDRFAPLFEASDPSFEGFLRRRDRKHRNQRITAGVVGIAIFVAAIWFVAAAGSIRTRTPAAPSPSAPSDARRVGFIGVPPEGAVPSTPERGELVLGLWGRPTSFRGGLYRLWVYADGRLIWMRDGDLPYGANRLSTGYLEQRLTPEGVELLRSELVSSGLFDHHLALVGKRGPIWETIEVRSGDRLVRVDWARSDFPYLQDAHATIATPEQARALERLDALLTDPASWLPASAWEDQDIRAYVPSLFEVCNEGRTRGIERISALLPGSVGDPLLGQNGCSDVTTEDARALAAALDDAGIERMPDGIEPWTDTEGAYVLSFRRNTVHIWFEPYLPHGEVTCSACG